MVSMFSGNLGLFSILCGKLSFRLSVVLCCVHPMLEETESAMNNGAVRMRKGYLIVVHEVEPWNDMQPYP